MSFEKVAKDLIAEIPRVLTSTSNQNFVLPANILSYYFGPPPLYGFFNSDTNITDIAHYLRGKSQQIKVTSQAQVIQSSFGFVGFFGQDLSLFQITYVGDPIYERELVREEGMDVKITTNFKFFAIHPENKIDFEVRNAMA